MGYGIARGEEPGVHAAHLYLHRLTNDKMIVKLDFRNSFNSVHRDMMKTVEELVPILLDLPFGHPAYSKPSHLHVFCGNNLLSSSEGIQQGDPLGPVVFAYPSTTYTVTEVEVLCFIWMIELESNLNHPNSLGSGKNVWILNCLSNQRYLVTHI